MNDVVYFLAYKESQQVLCKMRGHVHPQWWGGRDSASERISFASIDDARGYAIRHQVRDAVIVRIAPSVEEVFSVIEPVEGR